jgi:hypothetical protein
VFINFDPTESAYREIDGALSLCDMRLTNGAIDGIEGVGNASL